MYCVGTHRPCLPTLLWCMERRNGAFKKKRRTPRARLTQPQQRCFRFRTLLECRWSGTSTSGSGATCRDSSRYGHNDKHTPLLPSCVSILQRRHNPLPFVHFVKTLTVEPTRSLLVHPAPPKNTHNQTFVEQEDAFLQLIEGLYPTNSELDRSSRDALRFVCLSCRLYLCDLSLLWLYRVWWVGGWMSDCDAPQVRMHACPSVPNPSDLSLSTSHANKTVSHDPLHPSLTYHSYEAQNLFLELDNLREAAKFQRPRVRGFRRVREDFCSWGCVYVWKRWGDGSCGAWRGNNGALCIVLKKPVAIEPPKCP